ncbi:MAG: [protein-PII] uridylyltransferase [Xanthomonadales bacterium]|nr:[protein-PII] uridylyltransferase [Xanthomonadales bacterium]
MSAATTGAGSIARRPSLAEFRQALAARFRRTRRARACMRALSTRIDAELRALWSQLMSDVEARHTRLRACLIATGGYGRGQLFPGSDVDVLVLVPEGRDAVLDATVRAFLAAAWDLGLELASSVRTLQGLTEFVAQDLAGYTALLDARLLCGDEGLYGRMQNALRTPTMWPAADFLRAKIGERDERQARHADTAHNLEPNLKSGRGGLRDLHTARWIALRAFGRESWPALATLGLLEVDEAARLQRAERWLSDLRFALHVVSGRREERVLFDHQPALAQLFAAARRNGVREHPVEALMHRYFSAAGDIDRLSRALIERIARRIDGALAVLQPVPGHPRYGVRDGALELADESAELARPVDLIEPFLCIARSGASSTLGPELAHSLARALPGQRRALAGDRLAHEALQEILATRRPYRALTELHRHGLLGALLPPFARVAGRMQYDLFHVYTVDQHTLFLVRNLERFFEPDPGGQFALAHELALRVRQPELLFLAAIFHDIAKGRGGDHSQLGAVDARRYLKRRGYATADIDLVVWLVEHHLLMSATAQKQDIQDPEVVRRFAERVGDWERLECLYLLTVADIRATNPKLWNGWKARLLGDLYQAARFQLRRGTDQPVNRQDRVRATRLKALELLTGEGCMFSAVETLWTDFPEQSFWRYTPDQLRWLTKAIVGGARAGQPLVAVRAVGGGTREIFVRVPDQAGIFATIASVLDRMDLSVMAARILTCRSGNTLDTFQVLDLRREDDPLTRNLEIQMALTMALSEKPLRPRLAKRRATREQRLFRFPPQIAFETRADDAGTQLSLVCPDRPGLLAAVAHAFRDADVRVHSARIATFGERAEDFFTVTTQDGQRLDDPAQARLRAALEERLGDAQAEQPLA